MWFKNTQFRAFQTKIRADDPHAEFSWTDRRVVRCSRCLKPVTMRADNNTERWKEHRRSDHCKKAKSGQNFLTSFFRRVSPTEAASKAPKTSSGACPGLSYVQDSRIPQYLSRTVVPSGGAPRRDVLRAEILHDHKRLRRKSKLSPKQLHARVLAAERAQAKWLNHHTSGTVSSSKCHKRGLVSPSGQVQPCTECMKILRLKIFRNALRKPAPKRGHAKFTPVAYRDPVGGQSYLRHIDVQELMEMVSERNQSEPFDSALTVSHTMASLLSSSLGSPLRNEVPKVATRTASLL